MPKSGEHKTVHARILKYAEKIGWSFVSREKAEERRGLNTKVCNMRQIKWRSVFCATKAVLCGAILIIAPERRLQKFQPMIAIASSK